MVAFGNWRGCGDGASPGFWPGLVDWVVRLGLGQPEDEKDDQDDGNDGSTDVDAASGLSHVGFLSLTQRSARSAHMAEAFNGGCVLVLGDRPDIEADQVHVGLKEGGQLGRIVVVDEEEASAAADEVVPALDPVRVVLAAVVLFDDALGDFFATDAGIPGELAVEEHGSAPS